MTIKQLGGVFGRNPTFNDVTIEGTLTFDGDIDITSDLTVDGTVTANGLTVDTDTLVVDATNNRVGIGTSSPSSVLHLSTSNDPKITLTDTGFGASADITGSNGNLRLNSQTATIFDMADSEVMRIDASGHVGIGTTSPANDAKLHSAGSIISTDATLGSYNFDNAGFDFIPGTKVARFFATSTDTTGGVMTFITGQNASYGERMRIDSSGNVGIGTSTNLANGTLNVESNGTSVLQARSDTAGVNDGDTTVVVSRALNSTAGKWANAIYRGYTHAWSYGSSAGSNEAMRIDSSGNLLIGTTSGSFSAKITAENASSYNFESSRTGTGSEGHVVFRNGNGAVGSIFTNGLATVYNTSSDQRLKSNIVDAPSASDDIDAIQVRSFDWKADGSHQKYGMVAQELVTVAPQAVSQPEDPEEMMGVDYSKLVPMLIKEVQQLRARVAQLEGVN
jgi:hypothetical protein